MNYGAGYDYSKGCMWDGSRYMDYPLFMTVLRRSNNGLNAGSYVGDGTSVSAVPAGAATYTTPSAAVFNYTLAAKQYIDANDLAAGAGNYTMYVTVTAQVNY